VSARLIRALTPFKQARLIEAGHNIRGRRLEAIGIVYLSIALYGIFAIKSADEIRCLGREQQGRYFGSAWPG
jgi:hypothetical protein